MREERAIQKERIGQGREGCEKRSKGAEKREREMKVLPSFHRLVLNMPLQRA